MGQHRFDESHPVPAAPPGGGPEIEGLAAAVLDALPYGAFLVDQHHRIVHANPIACAHSLTGGDLRGQYCPRAMHGLDEPYPNCPLEDALECGCAVEREFHVEEDDLWLRSCIYPTHWKTAEGSDLFLHTVHDVTQHRREELARREADERYGLLFERMHTGLALCEIVCDEVGNPTDHVFLGVNPAFEAMTGLKGAEIEGLAVSEVLPGSHYPSSLCDAWTVDNGGSDHVEDHTTFRGRHFAVSTFHPRPGQLASLFSDVTESVLARRALEQTEETYRRLVENSPNGVVVYVGEAITFANRNAADLVGARAPEELLGRGILDFIHPDCRDVVSEPIQRVTQGRPLHAPLEVRIVRLDNAEVVWDLTSIPFVESDGSSAVQVHLRDITARANAEQSLHHTQAQLLQSQKLETVGTLAGGVAHDFNNILTAITGFSELILADADPAWSHRGDAEEIRRAAARAADLTKQLMAFSRRQPLTPKVFDLNEVLADVDRLLGRLLGEHVSLRTCLGSGLWPVRADPRQIEQVLVNLAVNARDAMPGGGMLTMETENVVLHADYPETHPENLAGDHVMLAVSDSGCGMTPQVRDRIFDPFFTTKPVGSGTGLGLSTVHGIVKQSGANIWVYSEPGQGTTFKIYFPRIEAPINWSPDRCTDGSSTLGDRQTGESILLVEDEPAVLRLAERVLLAAGYAVHSASTPKEALALVADTATCFDLLLTDVVLPGMSGAELAQHYRDHRPESRVLYMSGYTHEAVVHGGRLTEGVDFLEKPFSPGTLLTRVRSALVKPFEA